MVRIRLDIRIWTKVVGSWILNGVRSEYRNSWRVAVNPFIPAYAPAIVMDKNLVFSQLNYLGFQPLTDCISHVDPHAYLEFPLQHIELLNISKIFRVFPRLRNLSIIEWPIFLGHVCSEELLFFTLLIGVKVTQ